MAEVSAPGADTPPRIEMQPTARLEGPAILAGEFGGTLPGDSDGSFGGLGRGSRQPGDFGSCGLRLCHGSASARFSRVGAGAFLRNLAFQHLHAGVEAVKLRLHRGQLVGHAGLAGRCSLNGGHPASGERKGKGGGLKNSAHGDAFRWFGRGGLLRFVVASRTDT